jgi:hypothetical protein
MAFVRGIGALCVYAQFAVRTFRSGRGDVRPMTQPQLWRRALSVALTAVAMAFAGAAPAAASASTTPEAGSTYDPVYCGEAGAPAKPKCLKPIVAKVFNLGCNPAGGGDASMLMLNPNRRGGPEAPRTIQVYRAGELFFQDDDWVPSGTNWLHYTGLGAQPTNPARPAVFRIRIVKLKADEQVSMVFADKRLDFRGCRLGSPPPPPPEMLRTSRS